MFYLSVKASIYVFCPHWDPSYRLLVQHLLGGDNKGMANCFDECICWMNDKMAVIPTRGINIQRICIKLYSSPFLWFFRAFPTL